MLTRSFFLSATSASSSRSLREIKTLLIKGFDVNHRMESTGALDSHGAGRARPGDSFQFLNYGYSLSVDFSFCITLSNSSRLSGRLFLIISHTIS